MKRKRLLSDDWSWISICECFEERLVEPGFDGYIAAVFIDKVKAPMVESMLTAATTPEGEPLPDHLCSAHTLADDGFVWIVRMPLGGHYAQTVAIDDRRRVLEWYYDITYQNGVDAEGTPFFDDIYLDVVMLPTGEVVMLDADELDEALGAGDITREQHELAWREARKVIDMVRAQGVEELTATSMRDLAYFEAKRHSRIVYD